MYGSLIMLGGTAFNREYMHLSRQLGHSESLFQGRQAALLKAAWL